MIELANLHINTIPVRVQPTFSKSFNYMCLLCLFSFARNFIQLKKKLRRSIALKTLSSRHLPIHTLVLALALAHPQEYGKLAVIKNYKYCFIFPISRTLRPYTYSSKQSLHTWISMENGVFIVCIAPVCKYTRVYSSVCVCVCVHCQAINSF